MKKRQHRLLAVIGTAVGAVCLLFVSAAPANAATAIAFYAYPSGTVSPGWSQIPSHESYTFISVALFTTGVVNSAPTLLGSSHCQMSGQSTVPETYAEGAGTMNYGCSSGPLAGSAGGMTYVRVGTVAVYVMTGSLTGVMACSFSPNQNPPGVITSYGLTCVGALAAA